DGGAALAGGLRPVGGEVVAQAGDVLQHDDRTPAAHAADLEAECGGGSLLDPARVDVERLRSGQACVPLLQAVQLDVETGRELAYDAGRGEGQDARLEQHRRVVHRTAEAHDVEHHRGLVVRRVVEDLQAADLGDALADARDGQREPVVGEAGVDAVHPDRRAAVEGGL